MTDEKKTKTEETETTTEAKHNRWGTPPEDDRVEYTEKKTVKREETEEKEDGTVEIEE